MIDNSITSIASNKEYRTAMESMMLAEQHDYFITLTFTKRRMVKNNTNILTEVTKQHSRNLLNDWHKKIDKILLGRRFYKKPIEQRTKFRAFLEMEKGDLHYHLLVSVPDDKKVKFEQWADIAWRGLVSSGTIDIQELYTDASPLRRSKTKYTIKDLWNGQAIMDFIFSEEFIGNRNN